MTQQPKETFQRTCRGHDLNPGFGGPWDILEIFFESVTFLMLQKKYFPPFFFWISCTGSKVPFWQFGKMALLNQCMKFKNVFDRKTSFEALWRWHFQKICLKSPRVSQIQDLGQSEYKTEIFSKRTHKISKIMFNLGSYESIARLESKIRKCSLFDGSKL